MKKSMGESRFAALTSGLLARKGQAAPSNSPVADPAEEAESYAEPPPRRRGLDERSPAEDRPLIINERSADAGYPDNPTTEEIIAMEAAAEEWNPSASDPIANAAPDGRGPWTRASVPAVAAPPQVARRAAFSFRLSAREFLRLELGAAELRLAPEDLVVEALEEYLDSRGVESLGYCPCLEKASVRVDKIREPFGDE